MLEPGLRVLDDRERRILHLRFFEGLTQSQIAQQVGISQMHVSRLIRRSLEKIREEIGRGRGARGAAAPGGDILAQASRTSETASSSGSASPSFHRSSPSSARAGPRYRSSRADQNATVV